MQFYIDPKELQDLLIEEKLFTLDDIPSLDKIKERAIECQYLIENWVGYKPLPSPYFQEETLSQDNQRFVLRCNYLPVISVDKILIQQYWANQHNYYELTEAEKQSVWNGSAVIDFSSTYSRWSCFPRYAPYFGRRQKIIIYYHAGHIELPIQFKLAFKAVFLKTFKSTVAWLGDPVVDVQSIGISGVSKSVRLGKGAEGDPGTNLDRILSTYLNRYVQHYIY